MPHLFRLLSVGDVSPYVANLILTEIQHLDSANRQLLDEQLLEAGVAAMGPRKAAACARKLAYEADPDAAVERARKERKDRRVTIRPAPDTMAVLTGLLPVEQGVAAWAALRRQADTLLAAGDPRTRGQIMADTLVVRLTGQAHVGDVNVEVDVTMPVEALLDPHSDKTAEITGFGPIPSHLVRDLLATSRGRKWWRRLFTAPAGCNQTGPVIGGHPRRRRFDGWLAKLINLRDQTCRDPYCSAPIRHHDHTIRYRDGGPTSYQDGRGVCERGNYVREMPGWKVHVVNDGQGGQPHTISVTTPTGHVYFSQAPNPP